MLDEPIPLNHRTLYRLVCELFTCVTTVDTPHGRKVVLDVAKEFRRADFIREAEALERLAKR